ncbi:MAG: arsinothricin resistance N-acetyltransferase ArsN1 family A [Thermoleophilaceae bacterium]
MIEPAAPADARPIAEIYNRAIEERSATFETRPRPAEEIAERIAQTQLPFVVARDDGAVIGWGALSPYSEREVYAGVAEASVYVAESARGRGVGTRLVEAVADAAASHGMHKLLGKIFMTNEASMRLVEKCGFRRVGVHRRHGRLDGEWRDVLLVERLLDE